VLRFRYSTISGARVACARILEKEFFASAQLARFQLRLRLCLGAPDDMLLARTALLGAAAALLGAPAAAAAASLRAALPPPAGAPAPA
jgi:hypothetical protein